MQPAVDELLNHERPPPSNRRLPNIMNLSGHITNLTNTSRDEYVIETIQDISQTNTDALLTDRDSRAQRIHLTNRSRLSGPLAGEMAHGQKTSADRSPDLIKSTLLRDQIN